MVKFLRHMLLPVMLLLAPAWAMAQNVSFPGGFAPGNAPCYGALGQACTPVDASHGLPMAAAANTETTGSQTSATTLIGPIDTSALATVSFELTSVGSGNIVTTQASNGGTTWYSTNCVSAALSSVGTTTFNVLGVYKCNVAGMHYFRLQITTYSSGTVSATVDTSAQSSGTGGFVNAQLGTGVASVGSLASVATTGGIGSTTRLLASANSTNSTQVKASAGRLYRLKGYNAALYVVYLKLYNKAAPTCGTDTPVMTIPEKPSDSFTDSWADVGYFFSTAIGFCLTKGGADNDTTAVLANDIVGLNFDYQ